VALKSTVFLDETPCSMADTIVSEGHAASIFRLPTMPSLCREEIEDRYVARFSETLVTNRIHDTN
jgi:hypothetical protein